MSGLLSRDDIQAIAVDLTIPNAAFIDGKFAGSRSGETFPTVNPATGETITEIAACNGDDVDYAVQKAREAFERGTWSKMHPTERKETMIRLVKLIKRHRHELAVLESVDSGKPIKDCMEIDVPETMHCLAWHAEAVDKLYDQLSPSGDDAVGMIVREPAGVVGCVLPWNFPLMMLAWKLGPALASGNSVIIKPAEQTSMTALRIADLAREAGVPDGVLSVLPGLGEVTGQAIGRHDDIDVVSFTGSTEVGRRFLEYAAQSNLKRITLECGGKNPSVVLSDAANLDDVARHIVYSVFWNMGQNCTSNSRLIVHKALEDDVLGRVHDRLKDWRTGNPLDPANALGAIVTKEHFDKIMGDIERAKMDGAHVTCGGDAIEDGKGLYVAPTVFTGVKEEMAVARDEVFGPVLAVLPVGSDDAAIELANDTRYGLQASLYTSNVAKAHRYARAIKAGTISVNCYSEGDITTPFGGYKLSGFGGRDNSLLAHDQYTETKTIWINTGDDHVDEEVG
ncbi:MAG: aldehyde dehydrogenase [Hyphomicrobiaceae bacterium]|nr:aldehyde dehydrogenase [Hyphomicrobiaceae bacterium]